MSCIPNRGRAFRRCCATARSRSAWFIHVTLDEREAAAFDVALKEIPQLSAAVFAARNRRAFEEAIEQNIARSATVFAALGVTITLGVAYNAARIQPSEQARELAGLRIPGFTRAEVGHVLTGEILILALFAKPFGWGIGAGLAWLFTERFSSDLQAIPLVLRPTTFAEPGLVVLAAMLGSLLVVRRRLDGLDLLAVMKARE